MRRSYRLPPKIMTLEEALVSLGDNEIVEVTPGSVRLRKIVFDQSKRIRMNGGRSRV